MEFKTWFEAQNPIRVLRFDKYGEISFDVRGTRYTFLTDAGRFYNGTLARLLKYQPGKAFNELMALVKSGAAEQIEPKPEPPKMVQKRLF